MGTFIQETTRRLGIDEGCRLYKYRDTRGVVTIGIGFNLERGDAQQAIEKAGGDWAAVSAAPVAVDSSPANAVADCITQAVADALFAYSFAPIAAEASESVAAGVFDSMTDARKFVLCDLVYNLGDGGWLGFGATRELLDLAQQKKNAGDAATAHSLFEAAGDHLQASAWYGQVGARAKRDVAMIRVGIFCDPTGDGSDIL